MSSQPPSSSTANLSSTIPNLRSYQCYNCNNNFYIIRVSADDASSSSSSPPTSFRCPICSHLHLIPFHTVVPVRTPLNVSSAGFNNTRNDQLVQPPTRTPLGPMINASSVRFNSTPNNQQQGHILDSHPEREDFIQTRISRFLNSLPVKELNTISNSNTESSCSICMVEFGRNIVVELPCRHYFDKECIRKWIIRRRTCPMCRSRLSGLGDSYNNDNNEVGLGRELELVSRFVREARGSRVGMRRMNEAGSSLNAEVRGADQRVLVLPTNDGRERANAEVREVVVRWILRMNGGGESSRSTRATHDDDDGDTTRGDAA